MHSTPSARATLARRREQIVIADYSQFTVAELINEAAGLHETLASCHQFGRSAELGLRQPIDDQLLEIDREHERRRIDTEPMAA